MRVLAAIFICLLSTQSFSSGGALRTMTGNYCKDDLILYIYQKFNGQAKIKEMIRDDARERKGRGWMYWISVDACKGYFVVDFGSSLSSTCSMAHYGSRPQYLNRVWATWQCAEYISGIQEFPQIDYTDYYNGTVP